MVIGSKGSKGSRVPKYKAKPSDHIYRAHYAFGRGGHSVGVIILHVVHSYPSTGKEHL